MKAVSTVGNRVDPDKNTVQLKDLFAHLFNQVLGKEQGFGFKSSPRSGFEDVLEAALIDVRLFIVFAPEDTDFLGAVVDHGHSLAEAA